MKLIAEGASSVQIAAGQIAATTFLDACGVTMDEVRRARSVYERWIEGCPGPDDKPPGEGAEIRRVWGQAQTLAIVTACPHLAGAHFLRGTYHLHWTDPQPLALTGWEKFITDEEPPF